MTPPQITAPILISPSQLRSNPSLTTDIRLLINDAFRRSKSDKPEKWDFARPRFDTNESYYETLGDDAVVALIFDQSVARDLSEHRQQNESGEASGKLIACAAAVPWKGGWAKEGAGIEKGWEMRAVAVHEDEKYLHRGLAVKAMGALEEWAVEKKKAERPERSFEEKHVGEDGCVTFWLLVAECINGVYWRKRGYREVRRSTEGNGTWGCKTSFELVVYRKDVGFGLGEADWSP